MKQEKHMSKKDYSWLPNEYGIRQESEVHPHIEWEKSHLFDAVDGASTELEVLNWLHSTIRLIKPQSILETGSYLGFGTIALAHACKMNGFGKVYSVEFNTNFYNHAKNLIQHAGLSEYVELLNVDSINYLENCDVKFDLGFFDSENSLRGPECEICLKRNILNKMAVFHDTSLYRTVVHGVKIGKEQNDYRNKVYELSKYEKCTGLQESNLSRGFMVLHFKNDEDERELPENVTITAPAGFRPSYVEPA
jgi:predicted O-methyltransferase YrrM